MVIPSRNRWPLLRRAIATALGQRGVEIEVIIVDDASTDGTAQALAALKDDRIRVLFHEQPTGVSAARNLGLAHATAPWIAFLDDDDLWAPDHVSAMLETVRRSTFDAKHVGLVFSGHLDVDRQLRVISVSAADPVERIRDDLKAMNVVGCPARVLLPTNVVRAVGGFDVRLSIVADWDLWVRVLQHHEALVCPELLVAYTHHQGNMHLDAQQLLEELRTLRRKHGWNRINPRAALHGENLERYIAGTYRMAGRRFLAARWYARSFIARRVWRDLGRALGILVGERIIELSGMRKRPVIDAALGQWLEPFREVQLGASLDRRSERRTRSP